MKGQSLVLSIVDTDVVWLSLMGCSVFSATGTAISTAAFVDGTVASTTASIAGTVVKPQCIIFLALFLKYDLKSYHW